MSYLLKPYIYVKKYSNIFELKKINGSGMDNLHQFMYRDIKATINSHAWVIGTITIKIAKIIIKGFFLQPQKLDISLITKAYAQGLSIVGTRSCHPSAYKRSSKLINLLIRKKKIAYIVSGGANGCDSLAEKIAIQHKLPFIKVLPTVFTKTETLLKLNSKLTHKNTNQIIVVPFFIIHGKKYKYALRFRNLYIISLSQQLFSLQTPLYSGTIISIKYAMQFNKSIYFPEYPTSLLTKFMFNGQKLLLAQNIGEMVI